MANIIGKITLDFDKDEIHVWEMRKSGLVVAAMRETIKLGQMLPAIDVTKTKDGIYQLVVAGWLTPVSKNYGGHNRALANCAEKSKAECNLWNKHIIGSLEDIKFKSVKEVDLDGDLDMEKLRCSLGYLPLDVATRFCNEHNLDPKNYL